MRAALALVAAMALMVPVLAAALPLPARLPHPPILILGDAGFTAANGVVGGSGTATDPYVLAGWLVAAVPGAADGIRIQDTSAHVVVRDNEVREGDPGHPTSYCRYSLAIQCGPLGTPPPSRGISLIDAHNVVLESNDLLRNGVGVWMERSQGTLRGNTIAGKVAPLPAAACFDPLENTPLPPPPFPRQFSLHTARAAGIVALDSTLAMDGDAVQCVEVGVYGERSDAAVRGVRVADAASGVEFWGSRLQVEGSTTEATAFGFTFAVGTTGSLTGSAARGAERGAYVCGAGTRVAVEGNTFEDGAGEDRGAQAIYVSSTIGCPGAPHAEVVGNAVDGGYAGVFWVDGTGRIAGNDLTAGHWYGIYTQFASPAIEGNRVEGFEQGLIARCHTGTIAGNTLEGNDRGLIVYHSGVQGCGAAAKPLAQGNSFLGNLVYDVVNTEDMLYSPEPTPGLVALDVRGSWWGSAAGPDVAKVRGAVDAQPWRLVP